MRILVTGATGLIGKKVCQELVRRKHDVSIVSRDPERAAATLKLPVMEFQWDALGGEPFPPLALDRVDAIIHLAGEPIAERYWTRAVKERIRKSRTDGGAALAAALAECAAKPKVFVAASAIGFYGDRPGDEELNESSGRGRGFLAETCELWEAASARAGALCERTVTLRIGLVLSGDGGMLQRMVPPFRAGLGAVFGEGRNWLSWIHVKDLVRLTCETISDPRYSGVVNAVSPRPAWQSEFARELAQSFGRERLFKIPGVFLKLGLGDMSELMLGSQRVKPERANALGFKFEYESLASALAEATGKFSSGGF